MEKYYKNFILCGEIDNYCLLCQEVFYDEADIERHIRWEKHRKDIKLQEYLPKHKRDFIYKINNNYYYCEVCNLVIKNVAKHIDDECHKTQKTMPSVVRTKKSLNVKRESNGMVKVKANAIKKFQWHGIENGTCTLCDMKISNIYSHHVTFDHIVNLIQSHVKCEDDNRCYRELKADKYYCFTCFKCYDNENLSKHWIDCQKNNKTKSDANNNDNMKPKHPRTCSSSEEDKIDKEKKTSNCPCVGSCEMECVENLNKYFYDHGKRRSELAKYGKQNYIKLNEGGSKGYCNLCNIFISAHINCAKQHVEGGYHQGRLEFKGLTKDTKHQSPPYKTIPYKRFTENVYGPFRIAEYLVMVLNEGICVELISLSLIREVKDFQGHKGKCFGCDVTMKADEIKKHHKEREHTNIVKQCKVLQIETDESDDEFIREIHPGLYHCGFCNKAYAYWENMTKHLKSRTHKYQKGKKKLLSMISARLYLNPLQDVECMKEYKTLRSLDGID